MEGQDREALARRLVDTYSDQLLRLAYSLLNNVPDAQDVCQEALLKRLDHAPIFESREHERAWLIRGDHQSVQKFAAQSLAYPDGGAGYGG